MIQRNDVMPIAFLKKRAFKGSCGGMNYWLQKEEMDGETKLEAVIWPGPFIYEKTPEEKKERNYFEFSNDGIDAAVTWMNEQFAAHPDRWEEAKNYFLRHF